MRWEPTRKQCRGPRPAAPVPPAAAFDHTCTVGQRLVEQCPLSRTVATAVASTTPAEAADTAGPTGRRPSEPGRACPAAVFAAHNGAGHAR